MSNEEVMNLVFPLKDIRVRGQLRDSKFLYKSHTQTLYLRMTELRERFGTKIYDRNGNRLFLELWRLNSKKNTVVQLRWRFTVGENKKTTILTVPIFDAVNKKKKNQQELVNILCSVAHLPVYEEIMNTEIERVQLNYRYKSIVNLIQNIEELESCFMLEELMGQNL